MGALISSLGGFSTTGAYGSTVTDPGGVVQSASGGNFSALGISAAQVLKATPGRLCTIMIACGAGVGGDVTLNDCATLAAANAGNATFSLAVVASTTQVIQFNWPHTAGIVCSAVPQGGTFQLNVSFN